MIPSQKACSMQYGPVIRGSYNNLNDMGAVVQN